VRSLLLPSPPSQPRRSTHCSTHATHPLPTPDHSQCWHLSTTGSLYNGTRYFLARAPGSFWDSCRAVPCPCPFLACDLTHTHGLLYSKLNPLFALSSSPLPLSLARSCSCLTLRSESHWVGASSGTCTSRAKKRPSILLLSRSVCFQLLPQPLSALLLKPHVHPPSSLSWLCYHDAVSQGVESLNPNS
jgi:hypothetical protein